MHTDPECPEMAPEDENDLIEAVVTCEGNLHDPDFSERFQVLLGNLKTILYQSSKEEELLKVKKIEPWNSVRVTISIPKEAAQKLRLLAQQGSNVLRSLGILTVQVEGDQVISLTLAGNNNEPTEIVLRQSDGPSSSSGVSPLQSSLPTGPSGQNVPLAILSGSSSNSSAFRSPNVVAPAGESIPVLPPKSTSVNPRPSAVGGPYPFTSMIHAAQTMQRTDPALQHNNSSSSNLSNINSVNENAVNSTNSPCVSTSSPSPVTQILQSTFSTPSNSVVSNSNSNNNINSSLLTQQQQHQHVQVIKSEPVSRIVLQQQHQQQQIIGPSGALQQQKSQTSPQSQSLQLQIVNVNAPPPYPGVNSSIGNPSGNLMSSSNSFNHHHHQQLNSANTNNNNVVLAVSSSPSMTYVGAPPLPSSNVTLVRSVSSPSMSSQPQPLGHNNNMLGVTQQQPMSSPLLVNLLQNHEGMSPPQNPTGQGQGTSNNSMLPPSNEHQKRFNLHHQQQQLRKVKRGLSLDGASFGGESGIKSRDLISPLTGSGSELSSPFSGTASSSSSSSTDSSMYSQFALPSSSSLHSESRILVPTSQLQKPSSELGTTATIIQGRTIIHQGNVRVFNPGQIRAIRLTQANTSTPSTIHLIQGKPVMSTTNMEGVDNSVVLNGPNPVMTASPQNPGQLQPYFQPSSTILAPNSITSGNQQQQPQIKLPETNVLASTIRSVDQSSRTSFNPSMTKIVVSNSASNPPNSSTNSNSNIFIPPPLSLSSSLHNQEQLRLSSLSSTVAQQQQRRHAVQSLEAKSSPSQHQQRGLTLKSSKESTPPQSSQLTSSGKPRQLLINPLTGHLEPMPSESSSESDDEDNVSRKPQQQRRQGLKGTQNSKSRGTVQHRQILATTTTGVTVARVVKSSSLDSERSSLELDGIPKRQKQMPHSQQQKVVVVAETVSGSSTPSSKKSREDGAMSSSASQDKDGGSAQITAVPLNGPPGEKIKLRLKLEKGEPISPAYKVDTSFVKKSEKSFMSAAFSTTTGNPVPGGTPTDQPRVPPLHISLRGKNAAVVVSSPRREELVKDNEDNASFSSFHEGKLSIPLVKTGKRTKNRVKSTGCESEPESSIRHLIKTPAKLSRPRLSKDSNISSAISSVDGFALRNSNALKARLLDGIVPMPSSSQPLVITPVSVTGSSKDLISGSTSSTIVGGPNSSIPQPTVKLKKNKTKSESEMMNRLLPPPQPLLTPSSAPSSVPSEPILVRSLTEIAEETSGTSDTGSSLLFKHLSKKEESPELGALSSVSSLTVSQTVTTTTTSSDTTSLTPISLHACVKETMDQILGTVTTTSVLTLTSTTTGASLTTISQGVRVTAMNKPISSPLPSIGNKTVEVSQVSNTLSITPTEITGPHNIPMLRRENIPKELNLINSVAVGIPEVKTTTTPPSSKSPKPLPNLVSLSSKSPDELMNALSPPRSQNLPIVAVSSNVTINSVSIEASAPPSNKSTPFTETINRDEGQSLPVENNENPIQLTTAAIPKLSDLSEEKRLPSVGPKSIPKSPKKPEKAAFSLGASSTGILKVKGNVSTVLRPKIQTPRVSIGTSIDADLPALTPSPSLRELLEKEKILDSKKSHLPTTAIQSEMTETNTVITEEQKLDFDESEVPVKSTAPVIDVEFKSDINKTDSTESQSQVGLPGDKNVVLSPSPTFNAQVDVNFTNLRTEGISTPDMIELSEPLPSTVTPNAPIPFPLVLAGKTDDQSGGSGGGVPGEDSGIDSMDALSEKSPNQGESPARKEVEQFVESHQNISHYDPSCQVIHSLEQKVVPRHPEQKVAAHHLEQAVVQKHDDDKSQVTAAATVITKTEMNSETVGTSSQLHGRDDPVLKDETFQQKDNSGLDSAFVLEKEATVDQDNKEEPTVKTIHPPDLQGDENHPKSDATKNDEVIKISSIVSEPENPKQTISSLKEEPVKVEGPSSNPPLDEPPSKRMKTESENPPYVTIESIAKRKILPTVIERVGTPSAEQRIISKDEAKVSELTANEEASSNIVSSFSSGEPTSSGLKPPPAVEEPLIPESEETKTISIQPLEESSMFKTNDMELIEHDAVIAAPGQLPAKLHSHALSTDVQDESENPSNTESTVSTEHQLHKSRLKEDLTEASVTKVATTCPRTADPFPELTTPESISVHPVEPAVVAVNESNEGVAEDSNKTEVVPSPSVSAAAVNHVDAILELNQHSKSKHQVVAKKDNVKVRKLKLENIVAAIGTKNIERQQQARSDPSDVPFKSDDDNENQQPQIQPKVEVLPNPQKLDDGKHNHVIETVTAMSNAVTTEMGEKLMSIYSRMSHANDDGIVNRKLVSSTFPKEESKELHATQTFDKTVVCAEGKENESIQLLNHSAEPGSEQPGLPLEVVEQLKPGNAGALPRSSKSKDEIELLSDDVKCLLPPIIFPSISQNEETIILSQTSQKTESVQNHSSKELLVDQELEFKTNAVPAVAQTTLDAFNVSVPAIKKLANELVTKKSPIEVRNIQQKVPDIAKEIITPVVNYITNLEDNIPPKLLEPQSSISKAHVSPVPPPISIVLPVRTGSPQKPILEPQTTTTPRSKPSRTKIKPGQSSPGGRRILDGPPKLSKATETDPRPESANPPRLEMRRFEEPLKSESKQGSPSIPVLTNMSTTTNANPPKIQIQTMGTHQPVGGSMSLASLATAHRGIPNIVQISKAASTALNQASLSKVPISTIGSIQSTTAAAFANCIPATLNSLALPLQGTSISTTAEGTGHGQMVFAIHPNMTLPANLSHLQSHGSSGITVLPGGHKMVPIKLVTIPKQPSGQFQTISAASRGGNGGSPNILETVNVVTNAGSRSNSPKTIIGNSIQGSTALNLSSMSLAGGGNLHLVPISMASAVGGTASPLKVIVSTPIKMQQSVMMKSVGIGQPGATIRVVRPMVSIQNSQTLEVIKHAQEVSTKPVDKLQPTLNALTDQAPGLVPSVTVVLPSKSEIVVQNRDDAKAPDPIYKHVDGLEILDSALPQMNEDDLPFEADIIHDEKDLEDVLAGESFETVVRENGMDGLSSPFDELESEGKNVDTETSGSGTALPIQPASKSQDSSTLLSVKTNHLEQNRVKSSLGTTLDQLSEETSMPDSPILVMRSSSPLFTYGSRISAKNSRSNSRSPSPSESDVHGEDQEIIDSFTRSPSQPKLSPQNRPRDDTYGRDGDEEDYGSPRKPDLTADLEGDRERTLNQELSIEIPPVELMVMSPSQPQNQPIEERKSTRSTRSNTRLVSPDITAFRSDTPKPTKFLSKPDPLMFKNSPKPSPTGSLKLLSPTVSGLVITPSSSNRSSPVLLNQLLGNAQQHASLASGAIEKISVNHATNSNSVGGGTKAQRGTGNKRKRQESDSSSASKDENNSEEKVEMDLNSRPGKRRCSENAAELIKVCIGIEDTPKRNSMLIKKMEESKLKEAKMKKAMATLVEENEGDADSVESSLSRGKGGLSSRASSEDRSSSRGSSGQRNSGSSKASSKDEDLKEQKNTTKTNSRTVKEKVKGNSGRESPNQNATGTSKTKVLKSTGRRSNRGIMTRDKSPLTPAKTRTNVRKETGSLVIGSDKLTGTPSGTAVSLQPETENLRRKTRSCATVDIPDSDMAAMKRRRASKDAKS